MELNNIYLWEFERAVAHFIPQKLPDEKQSFPEFSEELLEITDDLEKILRERISTSFSRKNYFFNAEIYTTNEGSFYSYALRILSADDNEFLALSKSIANLLAENQKRSNIRDSALIIATFKDEYNKKGLIVIKAEKQSALKGEKRGGRITLETIKNVYLSQEEKLFKIGLLIEKNLNSEYPNDKFSAYLFDHQFDTQKSMPAEYFYKNFLGFELDKNSKVVTKKFFEHFKAFLNRHIEDDQIRMDAYNVLLADLRANNVTNIEPSRYKSYIPEDLHHLYEEEVTINFPTSFSKNTELLKHRLRKRRIYFGRNKQVKLEANEEDFNTMIKIIKDENDFSQVEDELFEGENQLVLIRGKINV